MKLSSKVLALAEGRKREKKDDCGNEDAPVTKISS